MATARRLTHTERARARRTRSLQVASGCSEGVRHPCTAVPLLSTDCPILTDAARALALHLYDVERRILAFSRDPDFTELYAAALEAADLPPVTTAEAADLANVLPAHPLAAALVDILGEPDWTAVTAIVERGIPTVVVTGWWSPDRAFRRRAFAAGAAAFVVKPVSPTAIVEVVRRVLDGERRIDLLPRSR